MNEVSLKQYAALLFMTSVSVKMFMLPALMLRMVGKTAFVLTVVYILLDLVGVVMSAMLIRRHPRETIFAYLEARLGKIAGKFVCAMLALFLAAKCVLMISEIKMFFTVTMYEEIAWPVMVIPLFVLMISVSRKRLRALGRTAELLSPVVLACTLILFALLAGDSKLVKLLPLFENGVSPVLEGLAAFPMWFGDGAIMLLFMGKVKCNEKAVKASVISYCTASVLVIAFSTMLQATYADISTLIDYGNNVSNMTQFSLSAQDYGRFDLLFFCVWMFSVLITLCTSFTFLTRITASVTGRRRSYPIIMACVLVLYVLSSFVFSNDNVVYVTMTGVLKYIVCPVPMLLAPTLLITGGRKHREKN